MGTPSQKFSQPFRRRNDGIHHEVDGLVSVVRHCIAEWVRDNDPVFYVSHRAVDESMLQQTLTGILAGLLAFGRRFIVPEELVPLKVRADHGHHVPVVAVVIQPLVDQFVMLLALLLSGVILPYRGGGRQSRHAGRIARGAFRSTTSRGRRRWG